MDYVDHIFYLIPRRHDNGENFDLFLPSESLIPGDENVTPALGFGVFAFLRTSHNRGKPRHLSFPAVVGFGEESRVVNLKLQSDYLAKRMRKSDRFSFIEDETTRRLGINASFAARKFPSSFRLAGAAAMLSSYNLWALIPDDREHLEMLWVEHAFYLIGHGGVEENSDVSKS